MVKKSYGENYIKDNETVQSGKALNKNAQLYFWTHSGRRDSPEQPSELHTHESARVIACNAQQE